MPYSTPVLSGSIPNPATQPLTGDLTWTASGEPFGTPCSLLLLMADVNGSTTFVDSSVNALTVTTHGSAAQSNSTAPSFQATAGDFTQAGGDNYVSVPVTTNGPLDLSTGDFTIEGWVYVPSAMIGGEGSFLWPLGGGHYVELIAQADTGGCDLKFQMGAYSTTSASNSVALDTWTAFAATVTGTAMQLWINGVASGTAGVLSIRGTSTDTSWTIGQGQSSIPGLVRLADFRVTKGVALYSTTYTPTGPLGPGGGTLYATGYDIYRNGVSIATVGAVLSYVDNVPTAGTYTYNVAAYVSGADASPLSNTVPLTYSASVVGFPNCIFDERFMAAYFGGQLNLVEFTYMPGRTPFEEGAKNLIINRYKQEPTDIRQRGVDFTQFVVPGEILQTVAVTGISAQGVPQAQTNPVVTPLVVTNVMIDPVTQLKFGLLVSGGQNGIEYTVQFTTTTNIQTTDARRDFLDQYFDRRQCSRKER